MRHCWSSAPAGRSHSALRTPSANRSRNHAWRSSTRLPDRRPRTCRSPPGPIPSTLPSEVMRIRHMRDIPSRSFRSSTADAAVSSVPVASCASAGSGDAAINISPAAHAMKPDATRHRRNRLSIGRSQTNFPDDMGKDRIGDGFPSQQIIDEVVVRQRQKFTKPLLFRRRRGFKAGIQPVREQFIEFPHAAAALPSQPGVRHAGHRPTRPGGPSGAGETVPKLRR